MTVNTLSDRTKYSLLVSIVCDLFIHWVQVKRIRQAFCIPESSSTLQATVLTNIIHVRCPITAKIRKIKHFHWKSPKRSGSVRAPMLRLFPHGISNSDVLLAYMSLEEVTFGLINCYVSLTRGWEQKPHCVGLHFQTPNVKPTLHVRYLYWSAIPLVNI